GRAPPDARPPPRARKPPISPPLSPPPPPQRSIPPPISLSKHARRCQLAAAVVYDRGRALRYSPPCRARAEGRDSNGHRGKDASKGTGGGFRPLSIAPFHRRAGRRARNPARGERCVAAEKVSIATARDAISSNSNSAFTRDGRSRMTIQRILLACIAIVGGASAVYGQEVTVKVGTVRSISTATILWAVEKGYFKDYGIKIVTETLDTAAN